MDELQSTGDAGSPSPPEGVGLTRYGLVRNDYFGAMISPKPDGAFVRYENAIADRRAWEAEIDDLVNALAAEKEKANAFKEALEYADSWLERHAMHVGRCAANDGACTCGLVAIRNDVRRVLVHD